MENEKIGKAIQMKKWKVIVYGPSLEAIGYFEVFSYDHTGAISIAKTIVSPSTSITVAE